MIRLGVCGWPVAHSRSPQMHNAALRQLGLHDWRYQHLPIPPHLFEETVRALPKAGFRGVNVTIPHKEAALELADHATDTARGDRRRQHAHVRQRRLDPRRQHRRAGLPAPPQHLRLRQDRARAGRRRLGARDPLRAEAGGRQRAADLEPHRDRARALAEEFDAVPSAEPADIIVNCTSIGLQIPKTTFKTLPLRADDLRTGRTVVDLVYRNGGTLLLNTARDERCGGRRRTGDPGRPGRSVIRTLDRPDGSRRGDAGGRHRHRPMSSPTDTPPKARRGNGLTTPSRRGGSGRILTDVIVDLGFVDRGTMDPAIARGNAERLRARAHSRRRRQRSATTSSHAPIAERFGLDHVDLKLYRVDPDAAKLVAPAAVRRYQAVPVTFVGDRTLLVAMVDPANVLAIDDIAVMTGYEVRPAVSSLAGRRVAARAPRGPRLRPRRGRARGAGGDRRRRGRPEHHAPAAPLYDLRENAPINFGAGGEDASVIQLVHRVIKEAVERGASDIHFEPQEEEMRVRYRIDGVLQEAATVPLSAVPAVISPRQDPLRPRHRRAPHPAGRPHLARGRRQADRPPRRHASRRLRREGRDANPRPEQGHDPARAAGHAPAGARAVHEGLRPGPRRGARHRPDRLRQVHDALRRAQPAQHDREAHHHDRGPGRVPARRASPRSRSTTRRA